RRGVGLALDQIAFPVARHQPVFDLRRAHMDADHVGNLAAPIHTPRARSARRLALAQADDQFLAQLTDRQGIDRVIDRLATDVGITKAGYVHAAQFAGNLLGRQTIPQHVDNEVEAFGAGHQLARRPTRLATGLHSPLRPGTVPIGCARNMPDHACSAARARWSPARRARRSTATPRVACRCASTGSAKAATPPTAAPGCAWPAAGPAPATAPC